MEAAPNISLLNLSRQWTRKTRGAGGPNLERLYRNEQKRPGAVSDQVYIPKCMIKELNAMLSRQFKSKSEIQNVAGQKGQAKMPNPITSRQTMSCCDLFSMHDMQTIII